MNKRDTLHDLKTWGEPIYPRLERPKGDDYQPTELITPWDRDKPRPVCGDENPTRAEQCREEWMFGHL